MKAFPQFIVYQPGGKKMKYAILPDYSTMESIEYSITGKVKKIIFRSAEDLIKVQKTLKENN